MNCFMEVGWQQQLQVYKRCVLAVQLVLEEVVQSLTRKLANQFGNFIGRKVSPAFFVQIRTVGSASLIAVVQHDFSVNYYFYVYSC